MCLQLNSNEIGNVSSIKMLVSSIKSLYYEYPSSYSKFTH
jgi:hypothetical protein